jgi:hypothetical protein
MKDTSWAKLASIAEILSAIVIVVTLLYLADQTRQLRVQTAQNTQALQATARQATLDSELGILYKAIEYPMLYTRPGAPYPELSEPGLDEADLARIALWEIATIRTRENQWLQYQDGALDSQTWESYRSVLVSRIRGSERTRKVWELYLDAFDPAFAAEVNSYISD